MSLRTSIYTTLALVAFAANSVLCRLALGDVSVDAASFTTIRLVSGAAMLWMIVALAGTGSETRRGDHGGDWLSAGLLFSYAVTFSFAYISLSTGTGALILFGGVQATMMVAGLWLGERPHPLEWAGWILALTGVVYLVSPGLAAPSLGGSLLMLVAGASWGVYSVRGREVKDAVATTRGNFVRAVPLALAVSLVSLPSVHLSFRGALLAALSGALASGGGYVLWYAALRGLTATLAATVQLSVPILAAGAGVIFLAEGISVRLLVSSSLILGGIGFSVAVSRRA